MFSRPYWLERIRNAWEKRSIVWLSGVRRTGKTTITKMLDGSAYVFKNCDLPSVQQELADPYFYFSTLVEDSVVIFDEIHRLNNPSQLLKIAADEFPSVRILATGSSTLHATKKFQDSLTGRKVSVHLPPVTWDECTNVFEIFNLDKRLLHGGLPESLLSQHKDPEIFVEWVESVYARDIQELFSVRNRQGFLKMFQLLLRQSGGQLDISKLSQVAEISRPTAYDYLTALETSHLIHLVRPFHHGSRREITKRPKCYAFDTGCITHERGWNEIRDEDRDVLWEHLVLDMLRVQFSSQDIYYWKDKSNREIDFVLRGNRDELHVIECKMDPEQVSIGAIEEFRRLYPEGKNFVLTPKVLDPYRFKKRQFAFIGTNDVQVLRLLKY